MFYVPRPFTPLPVTPPSQIVLRNLYRKQHERKMEKLASGSHVFGLYDGVPSVRPMRYGSIFTPEPTVLKCKIFESVCPVKSEVTPESSVKTDAEDDLRCYEDVSFMTNPNKRRREEFVERCPYGKDTLAKEGYIRYLTEKNRQRISVGLGESFDSITIK